MSHREVNSFSYTNLDSPLEHQPLPAGDPTHLPDAAAAAGQPQAEQPPPGPVPPATGLQTIAWTAAGLLIKVITGILLVAVRLMIALIEGYVALKQSGNPVTKLKHLLSAMPSLYRAWLTRQKPRDDS